MALFWRISMAVAAVSLIVLAVFVALAALQFDTVQSSLLGERLALLTVRTAAPFERAVQIGLPLASVRNADGLLERARQSDDAITAIHVFDRLGRVLHSTVTPAPATIPVVALNARAGSGRAPWHLASDGELLSGVEIASLSGDGVGGVLIVYSAAQNQIRVGAMHAELILAGVVVLLGSILAGAVLLRIGLRRQIRMFDAIEHAIADFERNAWRTAAGASPDTTGDADISMRTMLNEAEDGYRATGRQIAEIGPDR